MIKTGTVIAAALLLASCVAAPAFGYLEHSSVKIENGDGHGSGVVIGPRLVLTAKHVADEDGLVARTRDGDKLPLTKVWESDTQDLAIMQTAQDFPASVPVATLTCDLPKVGDPVTVIGNPLGAEFVFGFGHIASTVSPKDDTTVVMDLNVLPGDSGGPVLDAKGHVVGVVVAVMISPVTGVAILGGRIGSTSGYSLMEPVGDLCQKLPV